MIFEGSKTVQAGYGKNIELSHTGSVNDSQDDTSSHGRYDSSYYISNVDVEQATKKPKQGTDADVFFPEGTLWGWLSVLGGFCLCISTLGFTVSWGAFQAYYQTIMLKESTPSDIAWIGSLQYSLTFLPGIISGQLFDAGYFRACFVAGSVLYVISNFLIAECTKFWHFLLCQGFALGLASGLIYTPAISCISQWFKVKRPIVYSLAALGVSVGGIIFPIMFRNLVLDIGFPWTVRAMAFINLTMITIGQLTLHTRLPSTKKFTLLISLDGLFTLPYVLYTAATFVAFLGLYTYLTFISLSAVSIGIAPALAFDLVAIANGASALGRLGGGATALRYGPINAMTIFTAFAGICTYIWPFVTSHSAFIALAVIYGITSGAFVALFPAGTAAMGDVSDIGRRSGVQLTLMAFGALAGPPISGAILRSSNDFRLVGIYAGSTIVLSVALMMSTRYAMLYKLVGGRA